ncbi:hypothetical protein GGR27_001225 [Lewinella antarctica]|uniref:Uncharacterized protein n=1 Tax=Neolewinella antarctica TaxID=442734 RepID=A0ABX0X8Y4_9BACT|nr:hypothetical protein [Neolewinella antarctica]
MFLKFLMFFKFSTIITNKVLRGRGCKENGLVRNDTFDHNIFKTNLCI